MSKLTRDQEINCRNITWTSSSGQKCLLSELSYEHLVNVLIQLSRGPSWVKETTLYMMVRIELENREQENFGNEYFKVRD